MNNSGGFSEIVVDTDRVLGSAGEHPSQGDSSMPLLKPTGISPAWYDVDGVRREITWEQVQWLVVFDAIGYLDGVAFGDRDMQFLWKVRNRIWAVLSRELGQDAWERLKAKWLGKLKEHEAKEKEMNREVDEALQELMSETILPKQRRFPPVKFDKEGGFVGSM